MVVILEVDPLETIVSVVLVKKRGLIFVEVVEVFDETLKTRMIWLVAEMPVERLSVIPLLKLPEFASHKKKLFPGMGKHPSVEEAEIGKLLPAIARHFGKE